MNFLEKSMELCLEIRRKRERKQRALKLQAARDAKEQRLKAIAAQQRLAKTA